MSFSQKERNKNSTTLSQMFVMSNYEKYDIANYHTWPDSLKIILEIQV